MPALKKTFIKLLATSFGIGYIPFAGGTFASVFACLIYWFLAPHNPYLYLLILLAGAVFSLPVLSEAEKIFGRKDDRRIVLDEVIGFWFAVAFIPRGPGGPAGLKYLMMGFVLFRIFDIFKPFPIRAVQKYTGGIGVLADDVLAGILSGIILIVLRSFLT